MMRGLLILLVFISIIFFPWPFAVLLALISSAFIPLLPFAAGIFADTLYYAPHTAAMPLFTLYGAIATGVALLVHSRLKTSIIGG